MAINNQSIGNGPRIVELLSDQFIPDVPCENCQRSFPCGKSICFESSDLLVSEAIRVVINALDTARGDWVFRSLDRPALVDLTKTIPQGSLTGITNS